MDAQFSLVTKFNASGIAFYEYDRDTVGMFYHREQMTKTIFRGCFPDKCSESEKHLDDVIATGDNKNEGIEEEEGGCTLILLLAESLAKSRCSLHSFIRTPHNISDEGYSCSIYCS